MKNNERTTKPTERNSTGSADLENLTSGANMVNESTGPETAAKPKKIDTMRLNVVHLLFIHGLLVNFYSVQGIDAKMKNFLHDLIIMFEIYIDSGNPSDELQKHFKYSPLKPEENELS